jgi:hypothetical protein
MLRAKASTSVIHSASYRIEIYAMEKQPPASTLTAPILAAAALACMPAFQMG